MSLYYLGFGALLVPLSDLLKSTIEFKHHILSIFISSIFYSVIGFLINSKPPLWIFCIFVGHVINFTYLKLFHYVNSFKYTYTTLSKLILVGLILNVLYLIGYDRFKTFFSNPYNTFLLLPVVFGILASLVSGFIMYINYRDLKIEFNNHGRNNYPDDIIMAMMYSVLYYIEKVALVLGLTIGSLGYFFSTNIMNNIMQDVLELFN